MKTIIIVIETKKGADTDRVYIDKAIHWFYEMPKSINLKFVPMNGNGNYGKMGNSISKYYRYAKEQAKRDGSELDFNVIYVVDTDNYDANIAQRDMLNNIKKYCKANGYQFVWMCRDVERVFLKRKVPDSDKIKEANNFNRKTSEVVNPDDFTSKGDSYLENRSNLFTVLDSIGLVRKRMVLK